MTQAVFFDRDGVLNEDHGYLYRIEDFKFLPGVASLKQLVDAGFLLFLVTNQSGVGRGYYTMADVDKLHAHMAGELARQGIGFRRIYAAPEVPGQPSRGRKPSPQFLFDARDEFGVNLAESYMVGDKLIDLETGWNAGVKKSILVRTGYGSEVEREAADKLKPAVVVDNVAAAVEWILGQ